MWLWVVLYASKRLLQVFFNALEISGADNAPLSYRPFGEVRGALACWAMSGGLMLAR